MTASEQIKNYISSVDGWKRNILTEICEVVMKADPTIEEQWKWGAPVWAKGGLICSASAFKNHVSINFFNGANLRDKDKLFNYGLDSKKMRTIKFEEKDKLNKDALLDLVREAIYFNNK